MIRTKKSLQGSHSLSPLLGTNTTRRAPFSSHQATIVVYIVIAITLDNYYVRLKCLQKTRMKLHLTIENAIKMSSTSFAEEVKFKVLNFVLFPNFLIHSQVLLSRTPTELVILLP